MQPILLASSSRYRRELLARLRLPFEHQSPDIDERPAPKEDARTLAARLATQKAKALQASFSTHLIIGSDQVACVGNTILNKPLSHERAVEQLMHSSGRTVTFHTGLALLNATTTRLQLEVVTYTVHFRDLTPESIERYLRIEQPYDCAGSFKVEGLGISLFAKMEGDDPTSLIGLPLISLANMLRSEGIELP
ncbi:Maf family protein [Pseudomonas matsuisoli]|uniref:7-methyl-GTP pyrophosphatase n=1 Tax=Pseudomonas matsuisoli TaxID=1515666 RepID=A0A917UWI1_9PSED|nr:Maf family nucleotide pyrophosphatase [Pseudomonas matsuisoli]GGJ90664.1 Maf-like protein [Pseudomonas matsuisoli]